MNYSIILNNKSFNDIIKYIKAKGPLYFTLLWTIYQSYRLSKRYLIQQVFKILRMLPSVNNQIESFKNDMANTFQQSTLTLYKIPNEGMNETQIFNLMSSLPKSKLYV